MRHTLVSGLVLALFAVSSPAPADPRPGLEAVRGPGCFTAGDDDTPAKAKKAALALARQQAVERHRISVQSATTVTDFQGEEDLVNAASAAILQDVQIEQETQRGREVCVTITASISPVAFEELIQQKTKAKAVAQAVLAPLLPGGATFGVRVWTNKPDGVFVEGARRLVSVQAERDGSLTLDDDQADGTGVPLVPNLDGGQAVIRAGETDTFGGPGGKETVTIDGPFGAEAIKAVVSPHPFEAAMTATRRGDESRQDLGTLQATTRDLTGTGRAAPWGEAAVGLVTASRPAREQACALAAVRGVRVQGGC